MPSGAPELESARLARPGPGRPATLLVVLLGVGALWVWSRPRPALKRKRRPDMPTLAGGRGLHVERTVTVQRSPDEAYRAWRDLESLPRLLPGYLLSVTLVRKQTDAVGRGGPGRAPGELGGRAHGRRAGPAHRVALRAGRERGHRGLGPVRSRTGRARHGDQGDPHLRATRGKARRRGGGARGRRRRPARPRGAPPVQAARGDGGDRRGLHAARDHDTPRRRAAPSGAPDHARRAAGTRPGTSASTRSRIRPSSIRRMPSSG